MDAGEIAFLLRPRKYFHGIKAPYVACPSLAGIDPSVRTDGLLRGDPTLGELRR